MAQETEAGKFQRLEDFIALAKQCKKVKADIVLKKQLVQEKVHPEETADMSDAVGMYLLLGDFTLSVGGESGTISKVYAFGSTAEPLDSARVNTSVANERLKMDYRRLKESGIALDEKFF
jgi:hypothetical protein